MKIKKIFSLLLIMLLLCTVVLTGCSGQGNQQTENSNTSADVQSSEEADTEDLLTQIQERGEIVVAMEGTWAPWTYHNESDELVGYDVEVAQLIAEKLGVEVRFVEGEWDGLLAGLDDGRYDIMVNGVGITPERQEKYDFSTPYAFNRTAVIVNGDYDEIQTMEDAEVTFFDYVNAHPEADIKIATYSDEVEQVAIPVRKGEENASLLAVINEALAELAESGQLSELSQKYFGTDISQES